MFRNLFKKANAEKPIEPIFPEEKISTGKIEFEDGVGFLIVNEAYNNYPNKKYFPWCIQITLEYKDKNENGLPSESEADILNKIEDDMEAFIKQSHQTHFIGRVTKRDFRDILYYVDLPNFDEKSTREFLDRMNDIRKLNFSIEKDETWSFVSGLLK